MRTILPVATLSALWLLGDAAIIPSSSVSLSSTTYPYSFPSFKPSTARQIPSLSFPTSYSQAFATGTAGPSSFVIPSSYFSAIVGSQTYNISPSYTNTSSTTILPSFTPTSSTIGTSLSSSSSSPAPPSSTTQLSSSTGSASPSSTATLAGDFSSVLCNFSDVSNPSADPSIRWAEAKCDDAWNAVVKYWNNDPASHGLDFVQAVSKYWNGPQQWDCGKLGDDPCGGGPGSCGDIGDLNPSPGNVDTPAGWLILQSFTNFHNFQLNQYNAIGGAEAFVQGQMGQFSTTFAPIADPQAALKIFLDIVGIGLGLLSAAVWNKVLKDAPFFTAPNDPNNHGWAKDSANSIISQVLTLSKDTLQSAQTALGAQNSLASYTAQLINQWQNITALYTHNLFSGSTASPGLTDLDSLMANGSLLNNGVGAQGIYDMQSIMARTLFGLLVPKAWQTSNKDVHPVILLPENNATGCTGNPWSDWVSNSIAAASGVCYNNQAYYLFNVAGGPCFDQKVRREDGPQDRPCPNKALNELPGIGTMDGTAWGGVTRDDLVISALQAYILNNNANGYVMPELSNIVSETGETGDLYFENGIQTPGLVTIPICTIDVVAAAWEKYGSRNGAKPSGYPCVK